MGTISVLHILSHINAIEPSQAAFVLNVVCPIYSPIFLIF